MSRLHPELVWEEAVWRCGIAGNVLAPPLPGRVGGLAGTGGWHHRLISDAPPALRKPMLIFDLGLACSCSYTLLLLLTLLFDLRSKQR